MKVVIIIGTRFCAHQPILGQAPLIDFPAGCSWVCLLLFLLFSLYHSAIFRGHDELHYRGQRFRTSLSRSDQVTAYSARRHNHFLSVVLCLSWHAADINNTDSFWLSVLIERAQFAYNKKIYEAGAFKDEIDFEGSWLEWFLYETETFHGRFRTSLRASEGSWRLV